MTVSGASRRSGGKDLVFSRVDAFLQCAEQQRGNRIAEQYTDDIGRSEALTRNFATGQSDRRDDEVDLRLSRAVDGSRLAAHRPDALHRKTALRQPPGDALYLPVHGKVQRCRAEDVDGVFLFFMRRKDEALCVQPQRLPRARDIRADAVGGNEEGRNAGPAFDFPGNGSKVAAGDHRNRRSGQGQ